LFEVQYLKKAGGPPAAQMVLAAWAMVGRLAAVVIIRVLMTSSGVVAAAAKAPEIAPMTKSSCEREYYAFSKGMNKLSEAFSAREDDSRPVSFSQQYIYLPGTGLHIPQVPSCFPSISDVSHALSAHPVGTT
jgi:hypothetical protein